MDHPSVVDLRSIPLFAAMPDEALTRLAPEFEIDEHGIGHAIVREGESGYAFYVIKAGSVSVTQEGRELRTLGAGDFFGEISISGEGRRTATVTATSPVTVWVLFGTEFRALADARPDIAAALGDAIKLRLAAG